MPSPQSTYDFLIIGAGIFGITAAIELAKRKYRVGVLNPDTIPHHLAASTDVTKAVRMEYGSDLEYFKMAEICIERWKEWNELFDETLYHEVGFLLLCKEALESEQHTFEKYSYENLIAEGYQPDRLSVTDLNKHFPSINTEVYKEAIYNPIAGYAEAALAIEKLTAYARSLGVEVHEGQTAESFMLENGQLQGVKTREGQMYSCGHTLVAAGPNTPYLLPELKPYFKTTGQPLFWLKPKDPQPFTVPNLSVFAADISNSGWYGFPWLSKYGIIKIGRHTNGKLVHPSLDDRRVSDEEINDLRTFLKMTFPELADAPLVYTRQCLYTDTLDGHFWIDQHPEIKGLSVSTGGSGHGFKMGPVLGEMAADVVEGKTHQFSNRYHWRHLSTNTLQTEEARFVENRKL